jgi:hypothetical protein
MSLPVPAECTVKLRELLTVSEYAPTRLQIRDDEMLVSSPAPDAEAPRGAR